MPPLAALFSAMGVFGGWVITVVVIGVDDGAFWSQMQAAVEFRYDVVNGVIKSAVFGTVVSLIAVFEGFDCQPTAEGVSRAITRTVVTSALAILALDFVLTSFMFRGSMMSRTALDRGSAFCGDRFAALVFPAMKVGNFPAWMAARPIVEALRQHRRAQGARAGQDSGVLVGRVA